jgi:hypothetical protein
LIHFYKRVSGDKKCCMKMVAGAKAVMLYSV